MPKNPTEQVARQRSYERRATAAAHPERLTARRRWLTLAVIVAAQFMVVLDVAIVNVALPSIKTDLRLLPGEPAVGDHRLLDLLRRRAAARRPAG